VVLDVGAATDTRVLVHAGAGATTVGRGNGQRVDVALGATRFDVVNSAGSSLVRGGYGADRGFLEEDRGQFDHDEDVFGWSGTAVLLSARFLREVGTFDPSYFMYYEDTDLAWRGQLAGWRSRYVHESVVRHEHAASSKEGSALFDHYVERNRLVTLARNAPWSLVAHASARSARHIGGAMLHDGITPAQRHARAFAAYVSRLPAALTARRRQGVSSGRRAELVERWMT